MDVNGTAVDPAAAGIGLDELRELAALHTEAQGLDEETCTRVLGRITRAWGDGAGAWGTEWAAEGDRLAARGRHLEAARLHAMGRFPFPGDPARGYAQRRCVEEFDRWRAAQPMPIGRLEVPGPGGRAVCWTAGLSAAAPRPLLVVMGGIVSVKEQWGPLLAAAEDLGVAMAVTELPGVGENTLPYDVAAPRMLSAVLDALADRADVHRTAAVALSFGGHLALRCAATDPRIRAVATVGAPVRQFFEDAGWQRRVPQTTVGTLARLTRHAPPVVFGYLRGWGLADTELAGLDIPVRYIASLRDEIVPLGEAATLRAAAPGTSVTVFDDVHGSPAHLAETRGLLLETVLGTLLAAERSAA
ncbi:alpha/beta hydrolase [Kitasatospora sp. NPDC059571]|uniref:alpha/beta hydrolase n=1 Tax=Kitasatospora sp. NPDC059571 TaxID=3346871 RepID=UPI00367450EA